MIKIGVADFGLNVWYGGLYGYADRLGMLKEIGYDGIERLDVRTQAEAVEFMADAKYMGMEFTTCRGGSGTESLRWAAALGMKYVWAECKAKDFEVFCRQVNSHIEAAAKYGIKVALHNHLGTTVETQAQLEAFMEKCPDAGLLLDTGHLAGAGGDPIEIAEKYFDRLVAVHVKDYVYKDKNAEEWLSRIRFCELGAGEMGDINEKVIKLLINKGYDKWIHVEHDTHLRDPKIDLEISREYIRKCGI